MPLCFCFQLACALIQVRSLVNNTQVDYEGGGVLEEWFLFCFGEFAHFKRPLMHFTKRVPKRGHVSCLLAMASVEGLLHICVTL